MLCHRPRRRRVCTPGPEALEARGLLAQFGVPWHQADHLTVSFVPDGTSVAGAPSALFRSLDARQPTSAWQADILRALQTLTRVADIQFGIVPDSGQPLGTPGPDQGDPRFGDIRIAAEPMSPEVLAVSVPHDPFLSGTWSGDILLNDAAPDIGRADTLFPVVLHEIGHVLGLDDSSDPASVMYPHVHGETTLSPGDIAAVQALYGPPVDDPYEGGARDDTPGSAAPMPEPAGYIGATPLLFYANLSSNADVDFYSLTVPVGDSGPLTLRLQTAGVSLLEPHLTIRDAAGHIVGELVSTASGGDTLQVHLPDVQAGARYTVEVRGATADLFGTGEYVLSASFDARSTVGPDAIDQLARQTYAYLSADDIQAILRDPVGPLFHVDAHSNDTLATAEDVDPAGVYGSQAPDRITASLSDPTDVDFYHIETPDADWGDGPPLVMTVTVRATQVNGIMPSAAVFAEDGAPVPAVVLAHGDGTFTIQVSDAWPDSDYFIRVAADPALGKAVGNYDLDVEYGHTVAAPSTFLDGPIGAAGPPRSFGLVVAETQLFDLLLTTATPGAAVRMEIVDGQGRVLAERVATSGETAGGDPVLLIPGVYRVNFVVEADGDSPSTPVAFHLYGASLTDPIGPALDDPTLRPLSAPAIGGPSSASPLLAGLDGAAYYWLALSLGGQSAPVPSADPVAVGFGPIPALTASSGPATDVTAEAREGLSTSILAAAGAQGRPPRPP